MIALNSTCEWILTSNHHSLLLRNLLQAVAVAVDRTRVAAVDHSIAAWGVAAGSPVAGSATRRIMHE